jgi:hypothetical protein
MPIAPGPFLSFSATLGWADGAVVAVVAGVVAVAAIILLYEADSTSLRKIYAGCEVGLYGRIVTG